MSKFAISVFILSVWVLALPTRANLKIDFNYVDQSTQAIVRDSDETSTYVNDVPSTSIGTYVANTSGSETSASTGDAASASETFSSVLTETNESLSYSFSGTTSASINNVSTAINQAVSGVGPLEIDFTPDQNDFFSANMSLVESPVVGVAGDSQGNFSLEDLTTKEYLFQNSGTSFSAQLTAGDVYAYEANVFSTLSNFVPGDPNGLQTGFSSSSQSYAFSLQISPAPEPPTLLLMALGTILLILRQRKISFFSV